MTTEDVVSVALVGIMAGWVFWDIWRTRRYRKPPAIPGPDDMPTTVIRVIQSVPRLERSKQVIYRPADYATEHTCVDPDCESPRIAAGQIVEQIPTSHSFLFVCLDCIERSRQRFAKAME